MNDEQLIKGAGGDTSRCLTRPNSVRGAFALCFTLPRRVIDAEFVHRRSRNAMSFYLRCRCCEVSSRLLDQLARLGAVIAATAERVMRSLRVKMDAASAAQRAPPAIDEPNDVQRPTRKEPGTRAPGRTGSGPACASRNRNNNRAPKLNVSVPRARKITVSPHTITPAVFHALAACIALPAGLSRLKAVAQRC